MSQEAWTALLEAASKAVVFHWSPFTCIGTYVFCCFTIHKDIKPRMTAFVELLNSGSVAGMALPSGIVARYQMEWEKQSVASSGGAGSGATTQNYHKILFFRESAAPPAVQMMERKLANRA